MAAAVTFLRLLGRGGAAARSLPGAARCFGVQTSPAGEKVTHTGQVTPAARRAPSPSGRPGGRSPGSAPVSPGSSAPVPPVPQAQCLWSSRPAPRSLLFPRPSTRVPRSSPSGPRAPYPQSSPPVPQTPQTQRLRSRPRSRPPSGSRAHYPQGYRGAVCSHCGLILAASSDPSLLSRGSPLVTVGSTPVESEMTSSVRPISSSLCNVEYRIVVTRGSAVELPKYNHVRL